MARNPTPKNRKAKSNASGAPRRRDAEVVAAAAKVFYERGYSESSIQDIADELGMLKGSVYYYIDTKEDLLFRILSEVHDGLEAILEDAQQREDLEPLERLRRYVEEIVVFDTRQHVRMRVYYQDLDRLSEPRRSLIVDRRQRHEAFVTEMIEAAQASGQADPERDARLLTSFLFGAIVWIYRWYRPRGRVRPETIASACASFVLDGVRGSAGPPDFERPSG